MSQPILIKVYGNIYPVSPGEFNKLSAICATALPASASAVCLENDLARFSFEGIFFPLDEVLECVKAFLTPAQQGKLDYLDLENWILARHIFANGQITVKSSSLDKALEAIAHIG